MKYNITNADKDTLLQSDLNYKYRIYILKSNKIMDILTGTIEAGSYNIDADSDTRRTFSISMYLDENSNNTENAEQQIKSLIGYDLQFQIGIYNIRQSDYIV